MILQKLASALRRQDWFQVLIEVMIVIVGIFLGLQVTEWNDDREAKVEQDRFIEYLITDLENSIFYFDNQIILYENQLRDGRRTLELLELESLTAENKEVFERGLIYHGFASGLDNYLHTLLNDELRQVVDPVLRRSINNFIGSLRADEAIVQGNRDKNIALEEEIKEKAIVEQTTRDERFVDYDFESLKNDDTFRISFKAILARVKTIQNRTGQIKEDATILRDALRLYQAGDDIGELTFRNEERVG